MMTPEEEKKYKELAQRIGMVLSTQLHDVDLTPIQLAGILSGAVVGTIFCKLENADDRMVAQIAVLSLIPMAFNEVRGQLSPGTAEPPPDGTTRH